MIILILAVLAVGILLGIYLEKNFQVLKKNNNNKEIKEEKGEINNESI